MSRESRPGVSLWFPSRKRVELRQMEARKPGANEIFVEALFSGISHGSEMLVYRGEVAPDLQLDLTLPTFDGSFAFPIKYGYSSVGRVVETGEDVADLNEDDVVFAFNPHETCYTIPSDLAVRLREDCDERNGVFLANLETALNCVLDAMPRLGETVVITGQGVVGLLITQLIRKAGAGLLVTVDSYEKRRILSTAVGADVALDPRRNTIAECVADLTHGAGADIVIEASGQPATLDDAIRIAAVEARVVIVSWYGTKRAELSLGGDFHRKRLTLRSSQVSSIDPSLSTRWSIKRRRELAVSYLSQLKLGELITHRIPFARAAEAYELIDERAGETVQVILEY